MQEFSLSLKHKKKVMQKVQGLVNQVGMVVETNHRVKAVETPFAVKHYDKCWEKGKVMIQQAVSES